MTSLSGAITAAQPAKPTGPSTEVSARERTTAARLASASQREMRLFGTPAAVADDAEVRGFRLGWKASLLLTLILLAMPLGLVIAVPPVMACRERAERLGFFAGDTLQACIEHGIAQRLTRLEQRVTMLVRGSGR